MVRVRRRGAGPTRGALMLIAALLAGSAIMRLSLGAGQAIALDADAAMTSTVATDSACEAPPEVQTVLDALNKRSMRLDLREQEIAKRMQALAVADTQIEARLADLIAAEEALRATLALADAAAENDIARLVAVYESMKPKDAAALFEQMDPAFAAGFLARMRPDAAAGVLTGLKPETAYTISAILAGRNAEVPKQ